MKLPEDGAISCCDAAGEDKGEREVAVTEGRNTLREEIIALHQKGQKDQVTT